MRQTCRRGHDASWLRAVGVLRPGAARKSHRISLALHIRGSVPADERVALAEGARDFSVLFRAGSSTDVGCLGSRALIFGRVEDLPDRLACGEDTSGGQGDLADGGVGVQLSWMAQVDAIKRGL